MELENLMRNVKFIESELNVSFGGYKSSFIFIPEDLVVVADKVYKVVKTTKFVYPDAEEIEYVNILYVEDYNK